MEGQQPCQRSCPRRAAIVKVFRERAAGSWFGARDFARRSENSR
jgi:hypothetical protein